MMRDETQSFIKRLGKIGAGAAVAAVAVYGAIKPEREAEKALIAVQVSHEELKDKVLELQDSQANMEKLIEEGLTEMREIRAFVDGYLEGVKGSCSSGKGERLDMPVPKAPQPEPPHKARRDDATKPESKKRRFEKPKPLKELYQEQQQIQQVPDF